MFRHFSTFSRTFIFFFLTLSLLWSSFFFSSLPTSAASSAHILGSLTSKLPSRNGIMHWPNCKPLFFREIPYHLWSRTLTWKEYRQKWFYKWTRRAEFLCLLWKANHWHAKTSGNVWNQLLLETRGTGPCGPTDFSKLRIKRCTSSGDSAVKVPSKGLPPTLEGHASGLPVPLAISISEAYLGHTQQQVGGPSADLNYSFFYEHTLI